MGIQRREFIRQLGLLASVAATTSCMPRLVDPAGLGNARLSTRPRAPTRVADAGLHPLALASGRDGLLYVPTAYDATRVNALVVGLHGAGGSAAGQVQLLSPLSDRLGFVLLAVDSRAGTWDSRMGGFGPDVAFLDKALALTFDQVAVDPERVFLEGFSDGASYALGLGVENGDLFSRLVAFSPGYIPQLPQPPVGNPSIFVSHGTADEVLPYENTKLAIVPALIAAGYSVEFQSFDGGHGVPAAVSASAMEWVMRDPA